MTAHLAAVPGLFLNAARAVFDAGERCLSLGMGVHDTERVSAFFPPREQGFTTL